MKMRSITQIVVVVTALAMALYAWLIAYGPLSGTPEDPYQAVYENSRLLFLFLIVQFTLAASKKHADVGTVVVDLLASGAIVLISGYALFQEQFAGAEALSEYQERVLFLILMAGIADVMGNTLRDLYNLILTDDVKVVQ